MSGLYYAIEKNVCSKVKVYEIISFTLILVPFLSLVAMLFYLVSVKTVKMHSVIIIVALIIPMVGSVIFIRNKKKKDYDSKIINIYSEAKLNKFKNCSILINKSNDKYEIIQQLEYEINKKLENDKERVNQMIKVCGRIFFFVFYTPTAFITALYFNQVAKEQGLKGLGDWNDAVGLCATLLILSIYLSYFVIVLMPTLQLEELSKVHRVKDFLVDYKYYLNGVGDARDTIRQLTSTDDSNNNKL